MDCINSKENLSEFLDGEMTSTESAEIKKHLETCFSCRENCENMRTVGEIVRRNFTISAPPLLDKKIMDAFQNFHSPKAVEKPKESKEKIGWFGFSPLAFAAASVLFILSIAAAFQIGRMSTVKADVPTHEAIENIVLKPNEKNISDQDDEKIQTTKIVEVPVIRERLVKVPVIREKVVTKRIYINAENRSKNTNDNLPSEEKDVAGDTKNKYLTPLELKDFQPIAKAKVKITKNKKEGENDEN